VLGGVWWGSLSFWFSVAPQVYTRSVTRALPRRKAEFKGTVPVVEDGAFWSEFIWLVGFRFSKLEISITDGWRCVRRVPGWRPRGGNGGAVEERGGGAAPPACLPPLVVRGSRKGRPTVWPIVAKCPLGSCYPSCYPLRLPPSTAPASWLMPLADHSDSSS
jgi:hypothetical protein